MKKIYFALCAIICFSFLFCLYPSSQGVESSAVAASKSTTYAKASAGCVLYKNEELDTRLENIYFVVPETYFVTVLDIVSDDCMKVQYADYVGYIDSSTVVVATFIPIVKSLENIKFDIKETSGTQIWSTPSTNGTELATIPRGKKNINYISFAYGEIPSGGESNLWYYISYTPETNLTNVYEGYVYSENVTNLSEIVANTESNPEPVTPNENDDVIVISSSVRTLLIALIAIPIILLIAIILYKTIKNMRNFRSKSHNFAENSSNENFIAENYEDSRNTKTSLKDRIYNLKNSSFVRKNNTRHFEDSSSYPAFPTYDSDDDLL